MMDLYEHVIGLVACVGAKPDDVCEIVVLPGKVTYRLWARDENGDIPTVPSSVGKLPMSFAFSVAYEPPHEHGPDTHVHSDA